MQSSEALLIIIPSQKLPVPTGSLCKRYECNNVQREIGFSIVFIDTSLQARQRSEIISTVRVTKFDNLPRKP